MTIRLRAHHLLCMLTYVGKGYTPGFTVNYDRVAARLNAGDDIEIVAGPDDICAPLLADETAHCFKQSVIKRDEEALRVAGEWLGQTLHVGSRIQPEKAITRLRQGFTEASERPPCSGCQWADLCDHVAASGFGGARVAPKGPIAISP